MLMSSMIGFRDTMVQIILSISVVSESLIMQLFVLDSLKKNSRERFAELLLMLNNYGRF
nr:MAG TPA: hypothetical protein [Caudoviricetes sp.]